MAGIWEESQTDAVYDLASWFLHTDEGRSWFDAWSLHKVSPEDIANSTRMATSWIIAKALRSADRLQDWY